MVDTLPAKTVSIGLSEDNKENMVRELLPAVDGVEAGLKKSQGLDGGDVKPVVVAAPTIKELEAEEPLLQENPHRFVLFPIKYHEVCVLGFVALARVKLCLCFPWVMNWKLIVGYCLSGLANV